MHSLTLGGFAALDWAVLGGYLALLVATGLWFSRRRKQSDTTDYFLAGRRVPAWVAAMSLMATALSGATFVGTPQQAYQKDLTYLWSYAGQVLAAIIVATLFIPAFYRHNVATVYQLLEVRCGVVARRAASAMFMVGRVLASGARLYIAALAAALVLFGNTELGAVCAAIGLMAMIGIVYTFVGGIEAVVWTDVIQACVFVLAVVVAIVALLSLIPADGGQIAAALREPAGGGPSKLTTFKLFGGWGPAHAFTLVTAILGHSLIGLGAFGTDQDLTQRLLTCRTAAQASRAAVSGVVMTVPVALMFLAVGLLLYVFYDRPDIMGAAAPDVVPGQAREVFLTFILHELPAGLGGLMIAGLLAAALSSTNSELNAMSSTLICDFYRPLRPGKTEHHYVAAGRWGMVIWGVVLGGFAMISAWWHGRSHSTTLIDFALGVMTFAYSGLVGVFLTVLLTRRGSTVSVIAAFATGFVTVLCLQMQPWMWLGYGRIDLAFPWHMTIATGLALGVCALGRAPDCVGERRQAAAEF